MTTTLDHIRTTVHKSLTPGAQAPFLFPSDMTRLRDHLVGLLAALDTSAHPASAVDPPHGPGPRSAPSDAPAPDHLRHQPTRPEHTVDVSQPPWTNPYRIGDHVDGEPIDASTATELYRRALHDGRLPYSPARASRQLAGLGLTCTCPPGQPCHRDVLDEIANPRPSRDGVPLENGAQR